MTLNFLGDLGVAALLLLTTLWCMLLSRRLRQLRVDRGDVAAFVAAVEAAAARAEGAIAGIREAAAQAQSGLSHQRTQIDARVAELARLAEAGAQMARKLDAVLQRGARTLAEQQLGRDRAAVAQPTATATAARRALDGEGAAAGIPRDGGHGAPAPRRPGADLIRLIEGMR